MLFRFPHLILPAIQRAMGVVMIGGMLASIVFTFILVPVIFWYLERFETKFFKSNMKKT